MDIMIYAKDLENLSWSSELNESNPEYEDLQVFINSYDMAFYLAIGLTLGYLNSESLTQKGIDTITETWKLAVEEGFIQV